MPRLRRDLFRSLPTWCLAVGFLTLATGAQAGKEGAIAPRVFSLEAFCRKHYLTGVEFLRHGRYEDARESFSLVVESCPREADALRELGTTCLALGESRAAAEYFRRILAARPEDLDAQLGLAMAWAARGGEDRTLADSAAALFPKVLAADPSRATAYREAARVYETLGDLPASIMMEVQGRFAGATGEPEEAPAELGRKFLNAKVYAEAFRVYRRCVARDSSDTESLRILAYFRYRLHRPAEAAAAYETILRREPQSTTAMNEKKLLAECLQRTDRSEEAARRWEEVVSAEPTVLRNHYELTGAWLDAGQPRKALAAADRGLARNAGWACLWYVRGEALEAEARSEEAAGSWDRALVLFEDAASSFRRAWDDAVCGEKAQRQVERQAVWIERVRQRRAEAEVER